MPQIHGLLSLPVSQVKSHCVAPSPRSSHRGPEVFQKGWGWISLPVLISVALRLMKEKVSAYFGSTFAQRTLSV